MPIEIVASPLDWLPSDEERWAAFLETDTGKRLLPHLAESAPQLLPEGELNKILIRTGEVRGYQNVLRDLVLMAHPSAKVTAPTATEYPSLTDDSKWPDGEKLTPDQPTPEPTPEIPVTE